ncbi:hypothetical protein PB1A_1971 [Leuconostoc inhae]|uniref:Uncharacterized protein n=2 Tax=Leuconostoc TaxID=1243 RepID=A0AAN2UGL5_9LACO|nr:hypothetical protein LEGAS_0288 [Leuconostoc gasicomitatum LMG 18811]CUW14112.1 hypothetical protein C120C_0497 [Leuconostoc inhae]CUW17174.1 hypothetical protein C122C_1591 [Leuconostoc gasicomitatum]CUW16024.1 hypothetical protein KSL4_0462 [Leuconostoc inhae]CUW16393.1 hypothetical protein PL111_1233 [Leuconostoc inhae]
MGGTTFIASQLIIMINWDFFINLKLETIMPMIVKDMLVK